MARHKDIEWNLPNPINWDQVPISVLMDIRDELKRLNGLLNCHNFTRIPFVLDQIKRNTTKKKRARKPRP